MKKVAANSLNSHLAACGFIDMRFRWEIGPAGLGWDIVPTRAASKAYQGNYSAMRDFSRRRAQAVAELQRLRPPLRCAAMRDSRRAP